MRLLWSSRSPYARKVMIIAHELGVADQLELVPTLVSLRTVPEAGSSPNPLGQVPTLILDDGTVFYDSGVICDYLASLRPNPAPLGEQARFEVQMRAVLGNGLMNILIGRYSERRRNPPGAETDYATAYRIKCGRVLDELELNRGGWYTKPFDVGHAAICSGVSYVDFRFETNWREQRPNLAAWYEEVCQRPSLRATEYVPAAPVA